MLTDAEWALLLLWNQARGPQGEHLSLPDPGGLNDQAAVLLDAFAIFDSVAAEERTRLMEAERARAHARSQTRHTR